MRSARTRTRAALLLVLPLLAAGCAPKSEPARRITWLVGHVEPRFDPDGPPEPTRAAIERLLTRGLVRADSSGNVVGDAAVSWSVAADGRRVTFHLAPGLRFTDGSACSSSHFARALAAGLARADHGTRTWTLASLAGASAVRAGKPLPPLGLAMPDAATLVLDLVRPDPAIVQRIAWTGASRVWRDRAAPSWGDAIGLGPLRVVSREPERGLAAVRAGGTPSAPRDTLVLRFAPGEGRARAALRGGTPDVVWPVPPTLLDEPIPNTYRVERGEPSPPRWLLLVARADMPPTTRLATRRALANGVNRTDLMRALGPGAEPPGALFEGAPDFAVPGFDVSAMRAWMEQGKLGRSFHVTMAWDADGAGQRIARILAGEWARAGVYVDLVPLRGAAWTAEALSGWRSHLLIAEFTPLDRSVSGGLAPFVLPFRGPAPGGFRTGWRTREFDALLDPAGAGRGVDPAAAQARFEQELVVLPLARLRDTWIVRAGAAPVSCRPGLGPEFPAALLGGPGNR